MKEPMIEMYSDEVCAVRLINPAQVICVENINNDGESQCAMPFRKNAPAESPEDIERLFRFPGGKRRENIHHFFLKMKLSSGGSSWMSPNWPMEWKGRLWLTGQNLDPKNMAGFEHHSASQWLPLQSLG